MIQERKEEIVSDFKGTIIDIETIGDFNGRYRNTGDWREYEGIQQAFLASSTLSFYRFCMLRKKKKLAS